jgi:uncharacterized protein (TIGR03435 family)
MNRLITVIAAPVVLLWACATAAGQSRLAFEVVSIKPAPPPTPETIRAGTARIGYSVDGARVQINGFGLPALMMRAFRVQAPQIDMHGFGTGGPGYFEIQATLPAGATPEQVPEMLQTMLEERFKLAYHRETREYQIVAVTVGKSGMKLKRLPDGTQTPPTSTPLPDGGTRMTQTGTVASLFPVMTSFGGLGQMVDETGLDGIYTWVRELPPPAQGGGFQAYQEAMQDSFRAMIEAAGLKLETRKVSKETIVVEHLESTPTEN